jgi:hypothetical protein
MSKLFAAAGVLALAAGAPWSRVGAVANPRQDANQALPQFEVASIKPNKSGDGRVMLGIQPGGRFTATNVTLRMLIRNAYQLQDFQITGGPNWLTEDHYDIIAKAESGDGIGDPFRAEQNGQPSRGQLMIRALLADRFKLVVHNENKEMPIYGLILAKPDGKLPLAWIQLMRESIRTIVPVFNTHRMVKEYVERMYAPALGRKIEVGR